MLCHIAKYKNLDRSAVASYYWWQLREERVYMEDGLVDGGNDAAWVGVLGV